MKNHFDKASGKAIEQVLASNPKVSKSVVKQYRELEKKLEKLGVDTKSHYTLSPPLGGAIPNLGGKTG